MKNSKQIINNENLFTYKLKLENGSSLTLHKESYSDGTCFYTLEDERGKWDVNHGSYYLQDLINQMELEKEVEIEASERSYNKNNPKKITIYKELKKWRQDIINNLIELCVAE